MSGKPEQATRETDQEKAEDLLAMARVLDITSNYLKSRLPYLPIEDHEAANVLLAAMNIVFSPSEDRCVEIKEEIRENRQFVYTKKMIRDLDAVLRAIGYEL
jgi:hypothetical protein